MLPAITESLLTSYAVRQMKEDQSSAKNERGIQCNFVKPQEMLL